MLAQCGIVSPAMAAPVSGCVSCQRTTPSIGYVAPGPSLPVSGSTRALSPPCDQLSTGADRRTPIRWTQRAMNGSSVSGSSMVRTRTVFVVEGFNRLDQADCRTKATRTYRSSRPRSSSNRAASISCPLRRSEPPSPRLTTTIPSPPPPETGLQTKPSGDRESSSPSPTGRFSPSEGEMDRSDPPRASARFSGTPRRGPKTRSKSSLSLSRMLYEPLIRLHWSRAKSER